MHRLQSALPQVRVANTRVEDGPFPLTPNVQKFLDVAELPNPSPTAMGWFLLPEAMVETTQLPEMGLKPLGQDGEERNLVCT